MKRIFFTFVAIFATMMTISAQAVLDLKLIQETVENEKEYFQDILNIFQNDDPLLRTEDIALVYYGHSFLPSYNAGNDKNEEALKNYVAQGDNNSIYATAKKILAYNPVSLNALFYAWRSALELNRPESESTSYVTKYLNILNMITTYGDGKNSRTPFYVINPDDQDHIIYGIFEIEDVKGRELDTETLCNIISIEPCPKFPRRLMYINVSRYLSHTTNK